MFGKIKLTLAVFSGILLVSCIKKEQKGEVIEKNLNSATVIDNEVDHNKFFVDLPIKLDSSAYILYPVHESTDSKSDVKISYKSRSGYENYIDNLIFQHIESEKTHVLTKNKIKIISYEQLYNLKREAEKIIVYQVIDTFYDDKESITLTSLYIGTNDGKLFKKISKSNHHLNGWKYIPESKKVYFKTIEDIDKNNTLDNSDKHNIYSVSIEDFKVKELLSNELKILLN